MVELSCVELRLRRCFEFRDDPLRQNLAQLDAPLVVRIDAPDRALGEHVVLIQRHQRAEAVRRQGVGQDHIGRPVALGHPERRLERGRAFGGEFLGGLAEGQRLGLGEQVGHQQIVLVGERAQRVAEADEVAGDQLRALVEQLVERVLPVGARLAPDDRAGLHGHRVALQVDVLAVALHLQLLQIGGEAREVRRIGHDAERLRAEEVVVPDGQQAHQQRQVALRRRGAEMLVHRVEAREHVAEVFGADGDHGRQADRRIHRVAAADPVPEAEHVGGVDAELAHRLGVGRERDEVLGDGRVAAERSRSAICARLPRWSSSRAW